MKACRLGTVLVLLFLFLTLAAGAFASPAANSASPASLRIVTPADHAQLDAGESYPLEYLVTLGPGDDHFHVWVDGERSPGIHDLKGTYNLPKMTAGEHVITLKLVDKGHVPTGPQTSIRVTVK